MSLNKPQIKLLRGNSDKLMNSKVRLSANQPLYIKDKNYLLIGNDSELRSTKPITVPFVKGWIMDWQNTNNDWSISTDTDEISSYYFGPNPRSTGGVSLDAKDHFELSLSPINETPDTGIALSVDWVTQAGKKNNRLKIDTPITMINSSTINIGTESSGSNPKITIGKSSGVNAGTLTLNNLTVNINDVITYTPGSSLEGKITSDKMVASASTTNSFTIDILDPNRDYHKLTFYW